MGYFAEELAVVLLPRGAHQGTGHDASVVDDGNAAVLQIRLALEKRHGDGSAAKKHGGDHQAEEKRLGADGGYVVAFGDGDDLCIRMVGLLRRGAGNAHENVVQRGLREGETGHPGLRHQGAQNPRVRRAQPQFLCLSQVADLLDSGKLPTAAKPPLTATRMVSSPYRSWMDPSVPSSTFRPRKIMKM